MTDYTVGDTIYMMFSTRAFATGVPTVLAGTPVVSAYENDSAVQITAGITLGVSHDSVVGMNLLTIAATGANGFESGKDYNLVITTGTVGGVSVVGEVVGHFSLERSAAAVDLANGTDGLGAIKAETASILVDTGTTLDAAIAVIDGNVDQIETAVITNAAGADIAADIIAVKAETASILTDTGTTLDTKLNDIQGATFATGTDSLEAIRDRGDAAWTTGAGGSDRLLMVDTTIATLASQTSFTLNAGSSDNDAYNNCTIVIEDVSTATQKAVGLVSDYVGSTKTVTLKYDPGIFTIATTDKVYILAENALKSTAANRQLDVTLTGAAGIDWGNVENPGTVLDLAGTDIQLVDTCTVNSDMVAAPPSAASIADQVWDEAFAGHVAAGSFGARSADVDSAAAAILVDTTGLNGDAMRGTDGANTTTPPTVSQIADQVWDELTSGHAVANSFGVMTKAAAVDVAGLGGAAMRGTDGANTTTPPSAASVADQVWDELTSGHAVANSFGVMVKAAAVDVVGLNGDAMRGTDGANTTTPLSAAQVNAEVSDVLKTDTMTLPGQTAPPLAPTFEEAITWLYKIMRNKKTQTATDWKLFADDTTTVDAKAAVSDDGTTASKGEIATGP